ncbi:pentatricopeptide repeat-containing protein [Panicum miliaceum]|uniref:Pentatricopeptide repeat-containing protein n=1 Tax=Panicum miliaceum TaxID=4540 RepID=A0A3L6Q5C4_PANMI|nr:pentatricopeptide repeat-containing protein [Panicum miliaceum]
MQMQSAPLAAAAAGARVSRRPNLSFLADRCTTTRALARVHAALLVCGRLAENAFAASRLLAAYAKLAPDPAAAALALLSSVPIATNTFMINTTLRALASSPDPAAAFPLFARLRATGALAVPGQHTFSFLLKAAARLPHPLPVAGQLHALAFRHGVHLDAYVANGLVRAYSVAGRLGAARRVFDEVPERNANLYTTVVSAYAQNGRHEGAVAAFDEMVREGFEAGGATLSSVLFACARSASGGLQMGRRVHDLMVARGMAEGTILGTALVDMYAKNGAIEEAVVVFNRMPERCAPATWNALISGLAHHGHGKRALEVFERMQQEGVLPNPITLVGALSACCHAGLLDEARRLFRSMIDFGIAPGIQHYGCMVNLLGRAGLLSEAEETIRGMKCKADTRIWGALLTACKNHGNIEIAERVVVEMLKLDPSNHGVYVVLSNLYAEAGRWHDVDKLRKVMKGERLSKIPGASTFGGPPEQLEIATTR